MSACALTTEGNEPKMPKGASKEKTALDVELATAVKLKSSILAALSKGTTLCKTITGGDAGLVVCTMWLERGVENYNRYNLTTTLKRCFLCEWHSSTTRFRQIVTVGGWTWANNEGNVGKLSEAMKIVKGNLGNFGESFLVDSGKLKTRFATDLLLEELKRFNTVLKPKVDELEKILARLVAMHAAWST